MIIRSPAWRSDLFLISEEVEIVDRDHYVVARSGKRPDHVWKNFLLFPTLPSATRVPQWFELYELEFPGRASSFSIAFGWDKDMTNPDAERALAEARSAHPS
jgi:hypothetical protein